MPVQSKDLKSGKSLRDWLSAMRAPRSAEHVKPVASPEPSVPTSASWDWSIALGRLSMWLALAAFGGIWWGINGGFSVLGLAPAAAAFGPIGTLIYQIVSNWTFVINLPPAARALGLPNVQPVLPWCGVIAASLLQVIAIYRIRSNLPVPLWMTLATLLLSLYDFGTTWFGLGTIKWVTEAGSIVQTVLAVLLTFGLELMVGLLMQRRGRR